MRRAGPRRPVRVAIIGSGLGGLAAAVKLRQRTSAEFVIFERAAGIGGTWRDNTYPGCEVDIHSHAYSYSFLKYEWPRTHATQPELLAYAEHVVDVFGLRPHLRLNTRVTSLAWEESTARYVLSTEDGEQHEFDAVITATGLLSVPRYPDWPGLASFAGPCFHTARWEPGHDLSGKTVAIVGTGSTAVQVVPAIAPDVARLYVYQREPGWIEPKQERAFTRRELWFYRHVPLAQRANRAWIFYQGARRFKAFDARSKQQRAVREACVAFINQSVDDPATREAVTPQYPWGCKRVVRASNFYEALNRPNVELVPHEVTRVTPTGIVDATGTERQADVLILSTGFQPTSFLADIDVKGRDGRGLHDAWQGRPSAFLGITVPGFPNFFILYGPNTNGGGSIIHQLERQAEVAANAVRRLQEGPVFGRPVRSIDTKPFAQRRWTAWIDRRLATTASAMEAGCHNYYHVASGANVTQWPGTPFGYAAATRLLARFGLEGRRLAMPDSHRAVPLATEPPLAGKVVLIVGASAGIGADAARVLAADGASLMLAARSKEPLAALAAELEADGYEAAYTTGDVAEAAAVARFVDETVERFGRLDGAYNNAAMTQAGPLDQVAEHDFDRIMAVNVKGTWLCIREEVRVMRERGTGSIVNMSSIGGLRGSSGMGAYQATKHAVIGLTRTAAHDFGPLGIRVNVIAPGPTETPMLAQTRLAIPGGVEARIAATPLRKAGTGAEVGAVASFLLSDRASHLSGVVLPVDGGFSA